MKTFGRKPRIMLFAILPIAMLFLVLGQPSPLVVSAQTGANRPLSHREVKKLIETATTRSDHLRIAAYYQTEASTLHREAAEHADLESAYANGSRYSPKQYPSAYDHCKGFAQSMEQAAKDADALSTAHRDIAGQMKQ
ncbi:hypothetical protein BH10ACI4_BH10ACI4_06030 [soil metagenome]